MPDRFHLNQTWRWNLAHPPDSVAGAATFPAFPGSWTWCGLPVNSPLGVAAGPLLNGRWLLRSARSGFDILTYKTVRSTPRECYPLPNLVPVDVTSLSAPGATVNEVGAMRGSWAVSFGMPSVDPHEWQDDIQWTRGQLQAGQLLIVSVVGTATDTTGCATPLEQLAEDFAQCAQRAVAAGAHGIEANFSCPNVSTADGQLFQHPDAAGLTAQRIRAVIGPVPLMLKIGFEPDPASARRLIDAVSGVADGLAMTNAISATVRGCGGQPLFEGQPRGICGTAIRDASLRQVQLFADIIRRRQSNLCIAGTGGISSLDDVTSFLNAGAESVAIATAVMTDPDLAIRIRRAAHDRHVDSPS